MMEWLRPVAVGVWNRPGRCPIDIDELVQIGALAAVEATQTFQADRGASLKTWQWKHAEWAMREALKVSARRAGLAPIECVGDLSDLERVAPLLASSNHEPSRLLFLKQLRALVGTLPGSARQLITLVHWHDEARDAIAADRGVAKWITRTEHQLTLAALRAALS